MTSLGKLSDILHPLKPAVITEALQDGLLEQSRSEQNIQVSSSQKQKLEVITGHLRQSLVNPSREIVISGLLLIQAKSLVGHGNFRQWLSENFNMSAKTANRFMSVAQMVKRHQLDDDSIAKLLSLDLRVLYELAAKSTSASVQQRALTEIDSDKISYELIRSWKRLEQAGEPISTTAVAKSANLTRLRDLIQRFNAWVIPESLWLEDGLSQLDEAERQELQQQTRQLRQAIDWIDELLKVNSIQVESQNNHQK